VKGATVYPSEVETALRSIAEVTQAFVTDVPDAAGRPEIAALVVTDAPIDVVRGAVKGRLSAFKVPTRWLLTKTLDDVPLMGSGKVDKAALQQLLGCLSARPREAPRSRPTDGEPERSLEPEKWSPQ
jgi:acyl-CoA synthetase (AMP-forming)/AMP-acid ligase II